MIFLDTVRELTDKCSWYDNVERQKKYPYPEVKDFEVIYSPPGMRRTGFSWKKRDKHLQTFLFKLTLYSRVTQYGDIVQTYYVEHRKYFFNSKANS